MKDLVLIVVRLCTSKRPPLVKRERERERGREGGREGERGSEGWANDVLSFSISI